jgi:cation diffusion facilitator family transporter
MTKPSNELVNEVALSSVESTVTNTTHSPIKAILFALSANGGIALTKAAAAFWTGSTSMLAEAVHSAADCLNQVFLLMGLKQSQKPADSHHPLGYGLVTYFWSFVVALLLFSVGGLFSIYEGMHKLHALGASNSNEVIKAPWVAMLVLGVSAVLESISLWGCLREIKLSAKHEMQSAQMTAADLDAIAETAVAGDVEKVSLWQWLKNTRQSELLVVLTEDVAALLGLLIAFVFVTLSWLTADPMYDAIGSVLVGGILVLMAGWLGLKIHKFMIGISATPQDETAIRAVILQSPHVAEIYHLLTIQMGNELMLAVKVRMKSMPTWQAGLEEINRIEASIKHRYPKVRWSFFEPDYTDNND